MRHTRHAPKKHPLSVHRTERHGQRMVVFVVGLSLLSTAWYLIATNALIAASYELSDTVSERRNLGRDLDTLKTEIAATTNPQALEAKAYELGFQPVAKPSYLSVPGTSVARR